MSHWTKASLSAYQKLYNHALVWNIIILILSFFCLGFGEISKVFPFFLFSKGKRVKISIISYDASYLYLEYSKLYYSVLNMTHTLL